MTLIDKRLSDATITETYSVADGNYMHIIKYNSGTSKWESYKVDVATLAAYSLNERFGSKDQDLILLGEYQDPELPPELKHETYVTIPTYLHHEPQSSTLKPISNRISEFRTIAATTSFTIPKDTLIQTIGLTKVSGTTLTVQVQHKSGAAYTTLVESQVITSTESLFNVGFKSSTVGDELVVTVTGGSVKISLVSDYNFPSLDCNFVL